MTSQLSINQYERNTVNLMQVSNLKLCLTYVKNQTLLQQSRIVERNECAWSGTQILQEMFIILVKDLAMISANIILLQCDFIIRCPSESVVGVFDRVGLFSLIILEHQGSDVLLRHLNRIWRCYRSCQVLKLSVIQIRWLNDFLWFNDLSTLMTNKIYFLC